MGNAIFYRGKQYPSGMIGGSGGGGGSSYTQNTLWDTGGTTSRWASPIVANLSDNISNYDEISILCTESSETSYFYVRFFTSDIPTNYDSNVYFMNTGYYNGYAKATSDTQLELYTSTGTSLTFVKVIGIKY